MNSGNITIQTNSGTAYGIYAINGASVTNTGTITINGTAYSGNEAYGNFIYIDETSQIVNASSIISPITFSVPSLGGGRMLMMARSNITAPSVDGTLTLASSIVTDGNQDVYTTENLVTGDTQNLNVESESLMFTASTVVNEENPDAVDGVLTRKSFDTLTRSAALANYLEEI